MMTLYHFYRLITFIIAIGSWLLGFFVFLRGRKDYSSIAWFLFCLGVGAWLMGYAVTMLDVTKSVALWSSRVSHACGALFPVFFLEFVTSWMGLSLISKRTIIFCYAGCFGLFILSLSPCIVLDVVPKMVFQYYPVGKVGYIIYILHFVFWVSYAHYFLFIRYKQVEGYKRNQLQYLLAGTILGFTGAATCFPLIFNIQLLPYATVLIFVYLVTTTIAIIKYHLMDIRVAVATTGIFLFVYAFTLGIPFYIYEIGEHLYALIAAVLFASMGPVFYSRLRKRAEDKILKSEKADQEVLRKASKGLSKHKTVDDIVKFICFIIGRVLKVNRVAFYLNDGSNFTLNDASLNCSALPKEIPSDHELMKFFKLFNQPHNIEEFKLTQSVFKNSAISSLIEKISAHLAIPVIRDENMIGIIFLGEREQELPYSSSDEEVLGMIGDQVGLALENAGNLEITKKGFLQTMQDRRLKDIGILGSTIAHQMCNRLQRVVFCVGIFESNFDERALENDSRDILIEKIRELAEDMKVMKRNVVSAAEIADALKTYSKGGTTPVSISLKHVIKASKDLIDAKHPNFEYIFECDVTEDLKIYANEASIQDIFMNALDNGLDAIKMKMAASETCPIGFTPRIEIKAKKKDQSVLIEILDNGLGFKPENKEKMFIPFFTTKGSDKGTGLGLHAMRELIRRNGGDISITSEYLQGARILVTLPITDGNQEGVS